MSRIREVRRLFIAGLTVVALLGVFFVAYRAATDEDEPSVPQRSLTWQPPVLEDPKTISLRQDQDRVRLDDDSDYRISIPCGGLRTQDGLTISGGRNVVLIGGRITVTNPGNARGLYLVDQTGTVHVEGVRLGGDLNDGITLSQKKGAVVQLENVLVDDVEGSRAGHHGDVLQTWAGPAELKVNNLVGRTDYQGVFLAPNDRFDGDPPESIDLRNIAIVGGDQSGYSYWLSGKPSRIHTENLQTSSLTTKTRDQVLWPKPTTGDSTWSEVTTTEDLDDEKLNLRANRAFYDGLCD